MKKTISILLVICMALSVCACSGGGSDDPQKGSDRESYSPDYGELYYEANGVKFGIMLTEMHGTQQDTQAAIAWLQEHHVKVEVLGYV